MIVFNLIITFLLTFLSTGFMLYVAMVTGIGPWIGPVIGIAVQACNRFVSSTYKGTTGLLVTISSSIGGIVAVAFGFSFPTWFFLDPSTFTLALTSSSSFLLLCFFTVLVAGVVASYASFLFYKDLLQEKQLPFPVGTMTYNAVMHTNPQEKRYLLRGISLYCLYAVAFVKRLIGRWALPYVYTFYKGATSSYLMIPALTFDFSIMPLLISIGFIAGNLMAFPLICGAVLKMSCVTWLYNYYSHLSYNNFLFALCSGIVVAGTVGGLIQQLRKMISALKNIYQGGNQASSPFSVYNLHVKTLSGITLVAFIYLYKYDFSLAASLYLLIGSLVCAYQMAYTAGKIGLALLGRFATFVMIPGILLFSWNPLQVTLVATFVELVGGMVVDILHARKSLDLAHIPYNHYRWYHMVALVGAACGTALFFYYFVTYYSLGSSILCAQRAQARALLLQVTSVDVYVLIWGIIMGLVLKYLSCNPVLVLSGLLMPFSLLIPLIMGGMLAAFSKNSKKYESLFSGMYIANACGSIIAMFL